MSLPILRTVYSPTPDTLVRLFHQARHQWARHLTDDETQLDFGIALANPELNRVGLANRMIDVSLPPGQSPTDAVEAVTAHFASHGSLCHQWIFNPSAPAERTQPLADYFRSIGFTVDSTDVLHLSEPKAHASNASLDSFRLIPARASYRHTERLHRIRLGSGDIEQDVTAALAHLDDPHVDALLALRDGEPIGSVAVLAMGEVGLIEQLYVVEPARRGGVGSLLLARALEICARSVFKTVLAGTDPANDSARKLFERFGFNKVGVHSIWNSQPL